MNTPRLCTLACAFLVLGSSSVAHAYASAEILSTESYRYGRFEASIEFPSGSGVIGSFFLWKDGSEVEGTFWNELDFETLGFDCHLETNAYYGNPAQYHVGQVAGETVCGSFHTFAYEWTPDYVAWFVDGTEVRRESGETAAAYRDNAADGMQLRFNVWPGDASFGGTFDPSLLPVYQRVDWVQYSSFDGTDFVLEWREDFTDDAIPPEWELATWDSPKGLSTHSSENAGVVDGVLILGLTADDAQGIPGVTPPTGAGGAGGTTATDATATTGGGGAGGSGGSTSSGGATATGTDTISSTATASGTTSSVGGGTAAGGTAAGGTAAGGTATGGTGAGSTGGAGSSMTGTTTSSVTATTVSSAVVSSTAAATTGDAVTGAPTSLGGANGSTGDANAPADDDGSCACRAAGFGSTSGSSGNLAGFALLVLAASVRLRRRSNR